jgi:hypothetical protein
MSNPWLPKSFRVFVCDIICEAFLDVTIVRHFGCSKGEVVGFVGFFFLDMGGLSMCLTIGWSST